MRIAITTPTGNVGQHVLSMLVRAGVRPLVLARDPGRLPTAVHGLVDSVAVDQRDPDVVRAATRGVDALFWVDPTTGGEDPLADYARATEAVVAAVTDNGISRTVFQSSVGAEKRRGVGEIDGLAATEVALDATGASVTHLRCGYFFSNLLLMINQVRSGTLAVVLPLDAPLPWVAPRDIAEVAVTRLLNRDWTGRHVQAVHGPADLTWHDVARIVSVATGHPLDIQRIDDGTMLEALRGSGMTDALADAVLGMSTGLRDGFIPEQSRTPQSTTLTTLAAWCYDVLRPQL